MATQHSTTHSLHPTEASSANGSLLHEAANHNGDNSADDADSVCLGIKPVRLQRARGAVDQVHHDVSTSMLGATMVIGTMGRDGTVPACHDDVGRVFFWELCERAAEARQVQKGPFCRVRSLGCAGC